MRRSVMAVQDLAAQEQPVDGVTREMRVRAAALRLFRDKGYHATSMRDIAVEVGMNKGSLYSYIRSKEDLLIPLFEHAMGLLTAEIEAITANAALSPTERLTRAIHAHVLNVAEHLDILTVYLSEWRQLRSDALANVREKRERYAALFLQILEDGVRSGEFRAIDTHSAMLNIIGMCNWMFRWYRRDGRLTPDQIADNMVDLVLNGVRR